MAKRINLPSLDYMEKELKYKLTLPKNIHNIDKRLYSDLRPLSLNSYERTKREFDELQREKSRNTRNYPSETKNLPLPDTQYISSDGIIILVYRSHLIGFYIYFVDIQFPFGLNLLLCLNKYEVNKALSVVNPRISPTEAKKPTFLQLPREIRNIIYSFAIPQGEWRIQDTEEFSRTAFVESLGDPTGFHFNPRADLGLLMVNTQIRSETLPIAYRRTFFRLNDIDDFIKLAISIGKIGRDSIESLEFAWESKTDSESRWDMAPNSEGAFLKLPTLHVSKCVDLLNQCKDLKFLRLYFERDLLLNISPEQFKSDTGIRGLCSIHGLERLEIWSLSNESLDQYSLAIWLRGVIVNSANSTGRLE